MTRNITITEDLYLELINALCKHSDQLFESEDGPGEDYEVVNQLLEKAHKETSIIPTYVGE